LAKLGYSRLTCIVRALEVARRAHLGRRTLQGILSTHAVAGALIGEARIYALSKEGFEAELIGV
jgi:hypothetical protein